MNIEMNHIEKTFDGKKVLQDFSCFFPVGETTCIMGKSGVGKTTLLSILLQIEKTDCGEVIGLDGMKFSAVFQEDRLFEFLDAEENIHITTGKRREEIQQLLQRMDLAQEGKKKISEYSGGMRQRVAIARALLAEYDILVMDEPLKGLDDETKEKVILLIQEYTKGRTVIMVTHLQEECDKMASHCVYLE